MTFCLEYPIANIRPASYNPRVIDEESLERLRESIKTLGLVKPVIVTRDGTLLAGHQRTRAMQALGFTHCPAFVLGEVSVEDEVRFNQLHNASDLELGEAVLRVPPQARLGYVDIPSDQISGQTKVKHAPKRHEILRLLNKHGPWGSMIITQSGNVLVSKLYALASRILGYPCKAYVVPDEQEDTVLTYFSRAYGQFSYEHVQKNTWSQALTQMFRLRQAKSDKVFHSRTYECLIIPRLRKDMRILDFGAGHMDYVKKLKSLGYDIRGIEFYFKKGVHIDVGQVNRDIDALCQDVQQHGLYDLVIADSVMNSVDSLQAEQDVLTCLSALCKPSGTIVFSGRSRDQANYYADQVKTHIDTKRFVTFQDEHGTSAMFRSGVWQYQTFHKIDQVESLASAYFGPSFQIYDFFSSPPRAKLAGGHFKEGSWGVVATKQIELPLDQRLASLSREFDLPLPGGRRYGRSQDILDAYEAALFHSISGENL